MSRLRLLWLALPCAVATLYLGAPTAEAAVRYAAPGGDGPPPCLAHHPCSLYDASSLDLPAAERAQKGDEVVVLPGEYTGTGDLGPDEQLSIPLFVDIRGAAGQPRPVVRFAAKSGGLFLNGDSTASDLELLAPNGWNPLLVLQSTAERLVVKSGHEWGIACFLGYEAVLRDSACIATGTKGAGAGERVGTNPWWHNPRTLRNVTAIGTGPESWGLLFDISGGEVTADIKSTIAEGTAVDVEAVGRKAGGGSEITLEASAFATADATTAEGGVASVSEPGTEGNITAPPLLTPDFVHQLPGSPTIDQGVADEWSGPFDVDGDARVFEGVPDIGADELAPPAPPIPPLPEATGDGNVGIPPDSPGKTDESRSPSGRPETTLGHRPPRRTRRHRATFTFASTQPGSSFECKLDSNPYRPCRSPFAAGVGTGRHVFKVRAIAANVADPTPATFHWHVLG